MNVHHVATSVALVLLFISRAATSSHLALFITAEVCDSYLLVHTQSEFAKVYLRKTKPVRGMSPKLHHSGCLPCFPSDTLARLSPQMETHLLPAPS